MGKSDTRNALIAGGSGEIGTAVARRLAADGIRCFLGNHRSRDAAEKTVQEIRETGKLAEHVHLDLTDTDQSAEVCERIYEQYGSLDILVNCAAINNEAPALGMEDAVWEDAIDVNLTGAFRICRSAAKYMLLGRWGRIINLSSVAAWRGGRGQINYSASKSGLEAMTRVLALELGRKGILANCVSPGIIETSMSRHLRESKQNELLADIAMKRFGSSLEVAEVVAFLASDSASYITGQVIKVDGGICL